MSKVVEVKSVKDLESYYLVWKSLLNDTPGASFFHSLDWLLAWLRHQQIEQLRVLVVYSSGVPIGIVPLIVVAETTRLGTVRTLTYPLHDWASFYGPIGPNPTATLYAAMSHIRRSRRDWDLLDLRWIDRDGHDHGRTATAMRAANLPCRETVWKQIGIVQLPSWTDYLSSRTGKFRNNLRRAEKRVAALGNLQFERFRPRGTQYEENDPRWDLYDECVDLARRSWQGSSSTGTTLSHASVSSYFREVHELAVNSGAVDICLLRLDNQLVAFGYNYYWQGNVIGCRVGTDPDLAKHSLGTVLLMNTLRDGCQRGDLTFDMGPGSIESKRRWLTKVAKSYHCTHYPLSAARVQLLRLKHWTQDRKLASVSS